MKMKVGIRLGSGTTRINCEKVVEATADSTGKGLRYYQSQAWRKAALQLYRKHFKGKNNETVVHELSYSGAVRPFGTWHVQFSADKNPASLSAMFIVNVDTEGG